MPTIAENRRTDDSMCSAIVVCRPRAAPRRCTATRSPLQNSSMVWAVMRASSCWRISRCGTLDIDVVVEPDPTHSPLGIFVGFGRQPLQRRAIEFEEQIAPADLPSHLRERLASALETGLLGSAPTLATLGSVLGRREGAEDLIASLLELGRLGISGPAAAAWLRTIAHAASRIPRPDLVWSGPEVSGLHARDTRRVYEDLLGCAERSIWASTFAFFDGPKAFEVLARRMDSTPALRVTLLLNIQRQKSDSTASEHLVRRFADHFWKTDWPGSSRPRVFYDPRALDPEGRDGVLHAKAVVADDEVVFVTSANLTEAALDRNIELGVLIRDRALALTVSGYFRSLVDRDLLKPLPLT